MAKQVESGTARKEKKEKAKEAKAKEAKAKIKKGFTLMLTTWQLKKLGRLLKLLKSERSPLLAGSSYWGLPRPFTYL